MADAVTAQKDKRHRSPAYPFIPLRKAIERAGEFYQKERRHPAPLAAAAKHWGYGEKSSGGLQTISALKQFRLLEDHGSGADRKVKLTSEAFRILLDEVKDSPDRLAAIKRSALSPKLYAEMFGKWGAELPSDDTIRTYLRLDKGYNDDALTGVIRSFRDTLEFAQIGKSDTVPAAPGEELDELEEGLETPMIQQLEQPSVNPPGPKVLPSTIARELSSLPEGEAMLQWPANLSPESVQDLEDWLALVIKKMKRRYAQEKP